jgi:hypothetical protein
MNGPLDASGSPWRLSRASLGPRDNAAIDVNFTTICIVNCKEMPNVCAVIRRCRFGVLVWIAATRDACALDCPLPERSLVDRLTGCYIDCYRAVRPLTVSTIIQLPARVVDRSRIYRRVLIRERRLRA